MYTKLSMDCSLCDHKTLVGLSNLDKLRLCPIIKEIALVVVVLLLKVIWSIFEVVKFLLTLPIFTTKKLLCAQMNDK